MSTKATRLGPSRTTRIIIAVTIGGFLLLPLISTLLYTLNDRETGNLTTAHWANLLFNESTSIMKPITIGVTNSLILALTTVAIVLFLLLPTMILVNLRFPKLKAAFEFAVLLPISIPAIVLVVGLAPIYLQIGRTLGTGAWTLAFAYGITVLPFAYRAIQASIDAIDMRTLAEAARSLGSNWFTVITQVLAPNLRSGILSASLISVAVVLGEFTIASLLNRQVLQTALVLVNRIDPYASAIFTLCSLAFCFVLLLTIGLLARAKTRKTHA